MVKLFSSYRADFFDKEYHFGNSSNYGTKYYSKIKIESFEKDVKSLISKFHPSCFLDIGCAYGYYVKFFNECGIEAHGVDISKYAIDNKKHKNCYICNIIKDKLPFPDAKFDLILIMDVLEHLPDKKMDFVLSEISRVSSNYIVVGIPCLIYRGVQDKEEYETDPSHINVRPLSYIISYFEKAGFFVEQIYIISFWDYRIIFKKKFPQEIIENKCKQNIDMVNARK